MTDDRGGTVGWTASVISTAFTPPAGPAVAASSVSYVAGTITSAGAGAFASVAAPDLTGVTPVVTATGVTGVNSAAWNPTISVNVPAALAVGVYSATITHSVA